MNKFEKINGLVGKYMALIVLVIACISLFFPVCSLWIKTSWLNFFLMIIMFGMGLTLKLSDFVLVLSRGEACSISSSPSVLSRAPST